MGFAFCALAFLGCYFTTRRSVGHGLGLTLAVGYFYGILRANVPDGISHFMFDTALAGLYLAYFRRKSEGNERGRGERALRWCLALCIVPIFSIALSPFTGGQHLLVQLVGLRTAVLFVPALLIGAQLDGPTFKIFARWGLGLTFCALGVAVAELSLGIHRFFPENALTTIIYQSNDVGETGEYRIPSIFYSAHSYAGTMLLSLPLLLTFLTDKPRWKIAGILGVLAAVLGIFISATRAPVVQLFAVAIGLLLTNRFNPRLLLVGIPLACVLAWVVAVNPRFQRFSTLEDTDFVETRIAGSVNLGLLDIMSRYPLGKGLASAVGTSIPFFLEGLAEPQIGLENEVGRIALEQGLLGLFAWAALVAIACARRPSSVDGIDLLGRRAMWIVTLVLWGTSFIGTGMLSAIPGSFMLLLHMGVLLGKPAQATRMVPARRIPAAAIRPEHPVRLKALRSL